MTHLIQKTWRRSSHKPKAKDRRWRKVSPFVFGRKSFFNVFSQVFYYLLSNFFSIVNISLYYSACLSFILAHFLYFSFSLFRKCYFLHWFRFRQVMEQEPPASISPDRFTIFMLPFFQIKIIHGSSAICEEKERTHEDEPKKMIKFEQSRLLIQPHIVLFSELRH